MNKNTKIGIFLVFVIICCCCLISSISGVAGYSLLGKTTVSTQTETTQTTNTTKNNSSPSPSPSPSASPSPSPSPSVSPSASPSPTQSSSPSPSPTQSSSPSPSPTQPPTPPPDVPPGYKLLAKDNDWMFSLIMPVNVKRGGAGQWCDKTYYPTPGQQVPYICNDLWCPAPNTTGTRDCYVPNDYELLDLSGL